MNDAIAVLVGNGLSLAQYPDLALPALTGDITQRINAHADDGSEPAVFLKALAERVNISGADHDFEALIGPLDTLYDSLTLLAPLAGLVPGNGGEMGNGILWAQRCAQAFRNLSAAYVLESILDRSRAGLNGRGIISDFVDAVVGATAGGRLVIGNLNYDMILQADLVHRYQGDLCDMTDGQLPIEYIEIAPGSIVESRRLRTQPRYPNNRRLRILPLHGSITWVRSPEGTDYRVSIDDLRNAGYLEALRRGQTAWEPLVVLTNQQRKSNLVNEQPFALAYSSFRQSLLTADRWMIAGYSFRDDCVDALLADVLCQRIEIPPKILVVTHGNDLMDVVVKYKLGLLGPRSAAMSTSGHLHIVRSGIEGMTAEPIWAEWSAAPLRATA